MPGIGDPHADGECEEKHHIELSDRGYVDGLVVAEKIIVERSKCAGAEISQHKVKPGGAEKQNYWRDGIGHPDGEVDWADIEQFAHGNSVGWAADDGTHTADVSTEGDPHEQRFGKATFSIFLCKDGKQHSEHKCGRGGIRDKHREHGCDAHHPGEQNRGALTQSAEYGGGDASVEAGLFGCLGKNEAAKKEPNERAAPGGNKALPVFGALGVNAISATEDGDFESDGEQTHGEGGHRFGDPKQRTEEENEQSVASWVS